MPAIKFHNIRINGLNVRYYQGGQGEPLLIIHGGNSHALAWTKKITELSRNYTVFVPDLPGFGMSQAIKGNYYIPEIAEFIEAFTCTIGLDSFHLMGHSVGGAVVTSYALQFPKKVKRLVIIDSMCFGQEIALWVRMFSTPSMCYSIGRALTSVFKGTKWIAEAIFRSTEFILPFSEASLIIGVSAVNFKTQSMVLFHRLSEITVPTLVVWGNNDRIVPVKQAYAAVSVIPNCRLMVLKGGHSAYANSPEFTPGIHRFLSGNLN